MLCLRLLPANHGGPQKNRSTPEPLGQEGRCQESFAMVLVVYIPWPQQNRCRAKPLPSPTLEEKKEALRRTSEPQGEHSLIGRTPISFRDQRSPFSHAAYLALGASTKVCLHCTASKGRTPSIRLSSSEINNLRTLST